MIVQKHYHLQLSLRLHGAKNSQHPINKNLNEHTYKHKQKYT